LVVLQAAVGLIPCPLDICDVDGNCATTAVDALHVLKKAVGEDVELLCNCPEITTTTTTLPNIAECSSAELFALAGSDLDLGWKGSGHNAEIIEGASITFGILRRCSSNQSECIIDSDCPSGTCDLTCSCDPTSNDTDCEITGPTSPSACVSDSSILCTTNEDCIGNGDRCVKFFGPPLPLVASGVPTCISTWFQEPISGTADWTLGQAAASASLRARVFLGIDIETPCPRCGTFDEGGGGLAVGDLALCEGGINDGLTCTVNAVSPDFAGISADCPPDVSTNIAGQGLNVGWRELTVGTTSTTATLVCGAPFDNLHPSSGAAVCLNDFSPCSSNADCPSAPCGVYCHCGFCDDGGGPDPDRSCFDDTDCNGGTCTSDPSDTHLSQGNSNPCESLVCGEVSPEECCVAGEPGCASPTQLTGECNSIPAACLTDQECASGGNGDTCVLGPTPCFDNTITRSGAASPLGDYCLDDPNVGACTSNADCAVGACVPDSAEPIFVSLFCLPASANAGVNASAGTPGPSAIVLNAAAIACRCGDGIVGCEEQCDDGNNTSSDGCDQACRAE
jgi:cysteine-rich repeat protein